MPTTPRHGPALHDDGTATYRIWAPRAERVELLTDGQRTEMSPGPRDWWTMRAPALSGQRYAYSLDGDDPLPDPASRHQPDGVHGSSAIVDARLFEWSPGEATWRPAPLAAAAIYELHIGTFTPEGTLSAAHVHLEDLAELGVTHVEVMPVAAFNGTHGWGYDGVAWYAVHEPYGGPSEFVRFVDACHRAGLAVILDVVYNHLGPSGNYLPHFGPYLTHHYETPWGEALNLDGAGSDEVRAFIVDNALMWLEEYHVDGLRLDAVHGLVDTSAQHILAALTDAVRGLESRVARGLQLIAESDRQDPATVTSRAAGGHGLDAQWLDDLHHGLHVAVTNEAEGYYADYNGLVDVAAAYERGFVYDGRYSVVRGRTVGAPLGDVPSDRLVACVQNHDQVGNRPHGDRLTTLTDPERLRVLITLLCSAPTVPMLFMGEEYGETRPFLFFSSHPEPELAAAVSTGRRAEFGDFSGFTGEVPDPQDEATFRASVLDHREASTPGGRARWALWKDLLALRRAEPALATGRRELLDVAHADDHSLAVRRNHPKGRAVLVLANLADEPVTFEAGPGPWTPIWSSESVRYGGRGEGPMPRQGRVTVPSRSAALLGGH